MRSDAERDRRYDAWVADFSRRCSRDPKPPLYAGPTNQMPRPARTHALPLSVPRAVRGKSAKPMPPLGRLYGAGNGGHGRSRDGGYADLWSDISLRIWCLYSTQVSRTNPPIPLSPVRLAQRHSSPRFRQAPGAFSFSTAAAASMGLPYAGSSRPTTCLNLPAARICYFAARWNNSCLEDCLAS